MGLQTELVQELPIRVENNDRNKELKLRNRENYNKSRYFSL